MDLFDEFRDVSPEERRSFYKYFVDDEAIFNLNQPSNDAGWFEVSYCLAKPSERLCHVGISSSLLLVVTLSVVIKTLVAIMITYKLSLSKNAPLATLGDTIASFIEHPDHNTLNMCTFDSEKVRLAMESFKPVLPGPQRWTRRSHRRWNVLPKVTLIMSYLLFASGVITMTCFYADGKRRGTM